VSFYITVDLLLRDTAPVNVDYVLLFVVRLANLGFFFICVRRCEVFLKARTLLDPPPLELVLEVRKHYEKFDLHDFSSPKAFPPLVFYDPPRPPLAEVSFFHSLVTHRLRPLTLLPLQNYALIRDCSLLAPPDSKDEPQNLCQDGAVLFSPTFFRAFSMFYRADRKHPLIPPAQQINKYPQVDSTNPPTPNPSPAVPCL